MQTDKPHSYKQLDALRGIASVQVLNQHLFLMAPAMFADVWNYQHSMNYKERLIFIMHYSPLHLLYMAHEAVMLFFVLSGFVLFTSLHNKISSKIYTQYIIKRFFRLYVPFAGVILLSILLRTICYTHRDMSFFSEWFRGFWAHPVTATEFWQLITFQSRDFHNVVTSLWSIEIEMKICLLIPLAILLMNIFRRYRAADVVFNISLLVGSLHLFHNSPRFFSDSSNIFYDVFVVQYSFAFMVGMCLSKYLHLFRDSITSLGKPAVIISLLIITFFYCCDWIHWILPPGLRFISIDGYHTEMKIACAGLYIVFSFNKHVHSFLCSRYLLLLGSISYSLYLIHPVVMAAVTYTLVGYLPLLLVKAIIFAASIILAYYCYKYFEIPVNKLGRYISEKLFQKSNKAS